MENKDEPHKRKPEEHEQEQQEDDTPRKDESHTHKRKPEEQDEDDTPRKAVKLNPAAETLGEVSYTLKDGKLMPDGRIANAKLLIKDATGKSFTIEQQEAVLLYKADEDSTDAPTTHPAMVIGFYSQDGGQNFSLRVRWLITADELADLPSDLPWSGLSREKILQEMGETEVILSPQMEDLSVTSIADKVAVKLHVRLQTCILFRCSHLSSAPGSHTLVYSSACLV
jgi:hypothetical protein